MKEAGCRRAFAAIQVLRQRLQQLRQTGMPLVARPSEQIRRLDPAKSIGKFHPLDERGEKDLLAPAVLGFFHDKIAVA
jgi:hypothetical protein